MTEDYLIAFSSFYKAAYAQEKLSEAGIKTIAKRLPPEVINSCGYALTLKTGPDQINNANRVLQSSDISHKGIFLISEVNGKTLYRKVK